MVVASASARERESLSYANIGLHSQRSAACRVARVILGLRKERRYRSACPSGRWLASGHSEGGRSDLSRGRHAQSYYAISRVRARKGRLRRASLPRPLRSSAGRDHRALHLLDELRRRMTVTVCALVVAVLGGSEEEHELTPLLTQSAATPTPRACQRHQHCRYTSPHTACSAAGGRGALLHTGSWERAPDAGNADELAAIAGAIGDFSEGGRGRSSGAACAPNHGEPRQRSRSQRRELHAVHRQRARCRRRGRLRHARPAESDEQKFTLCVVLLSSRFAFRPPAARAK